MPGGSGSRHPTPSKKADAVAITPEANWWTKMSAAGAMSSDINELPKAKGKRCKNSEQISNAMSVRISDPHLRLAPKTTDPATTV